MSSLHDIAEEHDHYRRLDFLKQYMGAMDMGCDFAVNQLITRKTAELETAGFYLDNLDDSDFSDCEAYAEYTDIQNFAHDTQEMLRAQMVLVLWSFLERLFSDALNSLAMFHGSRKFDQKRKIKNSDEKELGLAEKWKHFFQTSLKIESNLDEMDWDRLRRLLHVRNFISHNTHCPGHPPKGEQKKAAERLEGLAVRDEGLIVTPLFLNHFFGFCEYCLHALGGEHWNHNRPMLDLPSH